MKIRFFSSEETQKRKPIVTAPRGGEYDPKRDLRFMILSSFAALRMTVKQVRLNVAIHIRKKYANK